MLATTGKPFDSDDYLFEIKWDGIRVSVYVEDGAYRLKSRKGNEMTGRYPELDGLASLPEGTLLDGELVVLNERGLPDFRAVLSREQARAPLRIQQSARSSPTTLIIFDQLYAEFSPLVDEPFHVRRQRLLDTIETCESPRLIPSDGVVGPGQAYFEEVVAAGLEGLVAKRLDASYQVGHRSESWIKMRRRSSLLCTIIGYVPSGDDFESLIVASDDHGMLRCVGRVGNGFDRALRGELNELLRDRHCDEPLIESAERGQWVKAGLYCSVAFLERTATGYLREPVFERLVDR